MLLWLAARVYTAAERMHALIWVRFKYGRTWIAPAAAADRACGTAAAPRARAAPISFLDGYSTAGNALVVVLQPESLFYLAEPR